MQDERTTEQTVKIELLSQWKLEAEFRNLRFWVVFRSERAVSTIFSPYIIPNGTYERIKKFSDTLPLRSR